MHIELPEKKYYKIGEVAKAFGVNVSLIRFWEGEFEQIQPKKGHNGNRLFRQDDIKQLRLIYHLVKEKGFTLEGAKNHLKYEGKQVESNEELINRLQGIRAELVRWKAQLDE